MNPYKELGVSENATQEEIRAAYLKMVKQYHPDKYTDSPLKEMAGEKLTKINLAYEMLTKKKNSSADYGGSYSSGSYGSSQSYGGASGGYSYRRGSYRESSYSGEYAEQFQTARSFISQNNLDAAKSVLDRIPTHNGEWYYLYGIIYLRQGWYERSREYLERACSLDPVNPEYQRARASVVTSGRGGPAETYSNVQSPTVVCCGPLLTILICDMCTPCC